MDIGAGLLLKCVCCLCKARVFISLSEAMWRALGVISCPLHSGMFCNTIAASTGWGLNLIFDPVSHGWLEWGLFWLTLYKSVFCCFFDPSCFVERVSLRSICTHGWSAMQQLLPLA